MPSLVPLAPGRPALPPAWLSLTVAAALTTIAWRGVSIDMTAYLVPWFDHISAAGPIDAFAAPFGNYAPPYLYLLAIMTLFAGLLPTITLIKLLAIAGTGALGLAVRRLLQTLGLADVNRGAALAVALPSVIVNAGALGQCDAWWGAAAIMAVATAVERRHGAMLAWFGLAVAFKAQAAFLGPFVLAALLQRRVPYRLWPIAPLAAVAAMLPAMLAGWPPADLAMIYWRQADTFQLLSFNAPNMWMIVQMLPGMDGLPPFTGLALALGIGASVGYVARFSVQRLDGRTLVAAALLAPLIVAGLLPRMHERFFFLADILALVVALSARDRAGWQIAALIQTGSVLGLAAFMTRIDALAVAGAVAMITATVRLARPMLASAANDNPVYPRIPQAVG